LALLGTVQQLSADAGALLSELAALMQQGKLGEARRSWEVTRPVLAVLLWLLPEHIMISRASVQQAETLASQSDVPGDSTGAHDASQGVAPNLVFPRTVAMVSASQWYLTLELHYVGYWHICWCRSSALPCHPCMKVLRGCCAVAGDSCQQCDGPVGRMRLCRDLQLHAPHEGVWCTAVVKAAWEPWLERMKPCYPAQQVLLHITGRALPD
jgi:hypothetical protein